MERDVLERIASALERLAPPDTSHKDWLDHPAYIWEQNEVRPIDQLASVGLGTLRGIDEQKAAVSENLERFATGAAAHDMLLWGARGMGKSALVRAGVHALGGGAALVQVNNNALGSITTLINKLAQMDRKFVLFIDDLGFGADEVQGNLALRSVLDGGAMARPRNICIAVTSNRRSIVQRDMEENAPLNERDERDNSLALADRFGLTLAFHPCDQDIYFAIIAAYTEPLGLEFDHAEAGEWAITRGNRSGRTAYQFAVELAGRAGLTL